MIVAAPDDWAGSVSGGCVEHAVIDEALGSLVSSSPQVVDYGVRDETAWSAGLSCGGRLRVLVETFPACALDPGTRAVGRALLDALNRDTPVVLASPMDPGVPGPFLLDGHGAPVAPAGRSADPEIAELAERLLRAREPGVYENPVGRWFLQPFPPRDRLLVFGGAEIAVRLIPMAHAVGFETVLVDPRRVLADGRRFVERPSHLVTDGVETALARYTPNESTYAVLLSHEPALDDPALNALLRSPARYIGALGGARTQEARRERLRAAGFGDDAIARIDGPVGMPIGAATPAEIAVSITARLVEVRRRS